MTRFLQRIPWQAWALLATLNALATLQILAWGFPVRRTIPNLIALATCSLATWMRHPKNL